MFILCEEITDKLTDTLPEYKNKQWECIKGIMNCISKRILNYISLQITHLRIFVVGMDT
jgi:ribosomal protein S17E